MLANRSSGPAPSVRAACSSAGSIASRDRRIARTISGNTITAQASAAPVSVNTSRRPNTRCSQAPTGPFTPKISSNSQPVTTGGSTSGRCTSACSTKRPGNRQRDSAVAASNATGKASATARNATPKVSRIASRSSAESVRSKIGPSRRGGNHRVAKP